MVDQSVPAEASIPVASAAGAPPQQLRFLGTVVGSPNLNYERYLKVLMVMLFLPEGLSFFIGDFRLSPVRVPLLFLSSIALSRCFQRAHSSHSVVVPSD